MGFLKYLKNKFLVSKFDFTDCSKELTHAERVALAEKYLHIEKVLKDRNLTHNNGEIENFRSKHDIVEGIIRNQINENFDLLRMRKVTSFRTLVEDEPFVVIDFLGKTALENGYINIAKMCALDPTSTLIQDTYGRNIGMLAADHQRPDISLITVNYENARQQQDNQGRNIAMHLVESTDQASDRVVQYGIQVALNRAMSYTDCLYQSDNNGNTIGIGCAERIHRHNFLIPCFNIAAHDAYARYQENKNHENMLDVALRHGYSPQECAAKYSYSTANKQYRDFVNQVNTELEL